MPNTIKISSTGDTLSLKKGDFYFKFKHMVLWCCYI